MHALLIVHTLPSALHQIRAPDVPLPAVQQARVACSKTQAICAWLWGDDTSWV